MVITTAAIYGVSAQWQVPRTPGSFSLHVDVRTSFCSVECEAERTSPHSLGGGGFVRGRPPQPLGVLQGKRCHQDPCR